jgi:deferrochelatase/peroxidase EfeB
MGRFANGTPVALNNTPQRQTPVNNFVYTGVDPGSGSDPFDKRCPVSAHIRKMNPRGDTPTGIEAEKSRRVARRGITYGVAGRDASVGLLFQCCQSSLEDQFEFLQGQWANETRKPAADSGTDPVIAERPAAGQTFPMAWNLSSKVGLNIGGFVTLRGGEYFFMPSIGFLRRI